MGTTRSFLSPGFRFHPTDVELVLYYLKRKVLRRLIPVQAIAELDLYKFYPWDLPDKSLLRSRDCEWYFFCPKDKKYATGLKTKRATEIGYWKVTGRDRPVGLKSRSWLTHASYRTYMSFAKYEKSGAGPKYGEQHGSPFKEEEWKVDLQDDCLAPSQPVDSDSPSGMSDDEKHTVTEDSKLVLLGNKCEPILHVSSDNASKENISVAFAVETEFNAKAPSPSVGHDIFGGLEDLNDREKLLGMYERDISSNIQSDNLLSRSNIECSDRLGNQNNLLSSECGNLSSLRQVDLEFLRYVELGDMEFPVKYPVKGDGPGSIRYDSLLGRSNIECCDRLGHQNSLLSSECENVSSLRQAPTENRIWV